MVKQFYFFMSMKQIKKLGLLISSLLVCHLSFAKDVIVTKQSEKIDAKIIEVSDEAIRYKKGGNLNGPTFVIKTKDISTVVYENGDIQTFKEEAQTTQEIVTQEIPSTVMSSPSVMPSEIQPVQANYVLYPINSEREMNGKSLTTSELENHLKENCTVAYNQWRKGRYRLVSGTTFLVMGCCLASSSSICLAVYNANYSYPYGNTGLFAYGVAGLIVGSSCLITSIPFYASGASACRKSIDTYNERCATRQSSACQFEFNVNNNGLGLALKF